MTIVKVMLASLAGAALLIILIAAAAFLFGYLVRDEDSRKAEEQGRLDGASFGKTADQAGCLTEGLKRSESIPITSPFKVRIKLTQFVRACLPESRPAKDFCRKVPRMYEIGVTEDWKTEQCDKVHLDEASSACSFVFEQQIEFCSK